VFLSVIVHDNYIIIQKFIAYIKLIYIYYIFWVRVGCAGGSLF